MLFRVLVCVLFAALHGCASSPLPRPSSSQGTVDETVVGAPVDATELSPDVETRYRAADAALMMVGKPYRFGGAGPYSGFDCSGLVQFSYKEAGRNVPRTTEEQLRASTPLNLQDLRRGDLLFFDHQGKENSHVGIYLGSGRFVHAPSSGKHVRTDRLEAPYWKKTFSEARRL